MLTRFDDFIAAIGYSALPPPAPRGYGLALAWPDVDLPGISKDSGWALISELTWSEAGGGIRDLCWARDEEAVTVTIFVSGEGEAVAREWFLARAAATSAPEIPYQRSGLELGQLAVETVGPFKQEILWIFHNVVFHLRAIASEINLKPIAGRFQELAAAANKTDDLNTKRPPVAGVALARGRVGQQLRVPILLEPPADLLQRYQAAVRTEGNAIDFVGFDGNEALFNLLAVGADHLTIDVTDRRTLLSNRIEVQVEVERAQPQ